MIDWVSIPAGPFPMGDDPARLYPPEEDETPRRIVTVEGFRISRTPVTAPDGLPLRYVSRADVEAFCTENGVRLPTEIEWEAAARGGDDRLWPWGDELPDTTRATFGQGIGDPSAVGQRPAGAALCGALDLAGNVWEWTADGAARGGSYLSHPGELRCTARLPVHPAARDPYVGFRVVAVEPRRNFGWVEVPAGEYVIGRDPDESRQRVVDLDAFELTRTPVTNAQYRRFTAETGAARPRTGRRRTITPSPSSTGTKRPPSARGPEAGCRRRPSGRRRRAAPTGARYPWGDEEDERLAAVGAGIKHGSTAPVGSHPGGASPYGLQDMAGNVWEWTSTEYPPGERVLRGGSFASPGLAWARCTMRSHSRPGRRQSHIGFRIARATG